MIKLRFQMPQAGVAMSCCRRSPLRFDGRTTTDVLCVWIALVAWLIDHPTLQAQPPERPNVILFLADDLGWNGLGCYGSELHQTPNLDALAAEGVTFTDAYSACTVCSPSRAAIMTGKYPARLHLTDFIAGQNQPFAKLAIPDWTKGMRHAEVTLAEALHDGGYKTAHVGKWHLNFKGQRASEFEPVDHGFDLQVMNLPRKATS